MPRLTDSLPKYRKHQSGRAVVTLSGVDFYLGPHGTKISRLEYDRTVGELLAAGRQLRVRTDEASELTVVELLSRYWKFAKQHYRKDGRPTGELENIRYAVRPLKELYGHTRVRDFGPLALKALQAHIKVQLHQFSARPAEQTTLFAGHQLGRDNQGRRGFLRRSSFKKSLGVVLCNWIRQLVRSPGLRQIQ